MIPAVNTMPGVGSQAGVLGTILFNFGSCDDPEAAVLLACCSHSCSRVCDNGPVLGERKETARVSQQVCVDVDVPVQCDFFHDWHPGYDDVVPALLVVCSHPHR